MKKYILILIALFFTSLFASLLFFNLTSPAPEIDETEISTEVSSEPVENTIIVTTMTMLEKHTYYKDCGHTVIETLTNKTEYLGMTLDELKMLGYEVIYAGNGKFELYQEVDGLCSADSSKYHILICENGIALYKGPIGYEEEFVQEFELDVSYLPVDIQNNLSAGGMEFSNKLEFYSLMESITEIYY